MYAVFPMVEDISDTVLVAVDREDLKNCWWSKGFRGSAGAYVAIFFLPSLLRPIERDQSVE